MLDDDPELGPFPLGCVAGVRGADETWMHFKSRAHLERRLSELGATVAKRIGKKVTHVVVPSRGEVAAEAVKKSQRDEIDKIDKIDTVENETCGVMARTVTESWVMRHVRARENGSAVSHDDEAIASFAALMKKLKKVERSTSCSKKIVELV